MSHSIIRVLIVDDHDLLRDGLALFLKSCADLEMVGEAINGHQAIRLCRDLKPDIVIMDIRMPEMDGITATRVIRHEMPTVQVIALTSYDEEKLIRSAKEAGVVNYLVKSISTTELAEAIRAAYIGKPPSPNTLTYNTPHNPLEKLFELTEREQDVLELMVQGFTNAGIADELFISYSTVKKHVHNILNKLGTSNRTEAVALAYQNQLIKSGDLSR